MGLNPGKKPRNLADMAVVPERRPYLRREEAVLAIDAPVMLSPEGDMLHMQNWVYRGRVVDFALNHYVIPTHPECVVDSNADVARIDTCHAEVHQHQYYRSGREQVYTVIRDLGSAETIEHAENAIAGCYDDCYLEMTDRWDDHLKQWKDAS